MPFHAVKDGIGYYLISYDGDGAERTDDPQGPMSAALVEAIASGDYTDVLIASHGWMGDIPAAKDQYDRWFGALLNQGADIAAASARRPGFRPLLVGLHWPSLPFGDEEMGSGAFAPVTGSPGDLVDLYVDRLGDTPEIRAALEIIAAAAKDRAGVLELPDDVADAYRSLNASLGLSSGGLDAPPDADRNTFDPEAAFVAARMNSFGGFSLGGLLAPLRQLSYWTMKKRARLLGEGAFHTLVTRLMQAHPGPAATAPRFHLMGHSFGCIVISSTICGPDARGRLPRPVDSVILVQGALSLWSYAPVIALEDDKPGYFAPLLADGHVRGPLVITRSSHDTAVGRIYPIASRLIGSATFAPGAYPKFGAIGAFGAQGVGAAALGQAGPMLAADAPYALAGGKLHNFDASTYISHGGGLSGAHNDIAGPEVAHLWWETIRNAG